MGYPGDGEERDQLLEAAGYGPGDDIKDAVCAIHAMRTTIQSIKYRLGIFSGVPVEDVPELVELKVKEASYLRRDASGQAETEQSKRETAQRATAALHAQLDEASKRITNLVDMHQSMAAELVDAEKLNDKLQTMLDAVREAAGQAVPGAEKPKAEPR